MHYIYNKSTQRQFVQFVISLTYKNIYIFFYDNPCFIRFLHGKTVDLLKEL